MFGRGDAARARFKTTISSVLALILLCMTMAEARPSPPQPVPGVRDARPAAAAPVSARRSRPPIKIAPRKNVAGRASLPKSRRASRRPRVPRKGFWWPIRDPITSRYGRRWGGFHHGIDIACSLREPIRAAAPGRVLVAGRMPIYGKVVIVRHRNGYKTLYAHLRTIRVRAGKRVGYTTSIGTCGRTGSATGTHLHFEVYKNGRTRNPLRYLKR